MATLAVDRRRQTGRLRLLPAGLLLLVLSACGVPGGAATTTEEAYAASRVVIDNFVGTLTVETVPDGAEVSLSITANDGQRDLLPVRLDGDTLTIVWEGRPDRRAAFFEFWRDHGDANLREIDRYPTLVLRAPAGVALEIDDIVGRWTVGDRTGPLVFTAERGSGTIGTTRIAELVVVGDGTINAGAVTESLEANIPGSGRIEVASAATAELTLSGSGGLRIGDIAGALTATISGSGDVVAGAADIAQLILSGSGEIAIGAVARSLTASISGSGRIIAASVGETFAATLSGSGAVEVAAGRATVEATLSGSGALMFRGTAVNPVVRVSGSGGVVLGAVEGQLRETVTGSGRVTVGP